MSISKSEELRFCFGRLMKILTKYQDHEDFSSDYNTINTLKSIATSHMECDDEISSGTASKVSAQKQIVPKNKIQSRIRKEEKKKHCNRMKNELLGNDESKYKNCYIDKFKFNLVIKELRTTIENDSFIEINLKEELLNAYPDLDSTKETAARFLSLTIFCAIKEVENDLKIVIEKRTMKGCIVIDYSSIEERIEKQFSKGYYYEYVEKTFILTPNSKTGLFKIEQITELSQSRLSEIDALSNTFSLSMNYKYLDVAKSAQFDYLIINDTDYTEEINSERSNIEAGETLNETFPYKKTFQAHNIPIENMYTIKRKLTREEDLPIYRSVFSLKYPAKKVHFHFRIAGDEKHNWRILANFSLPFRKDLKDEKNFIQSITDESVDITINEWCLRGSGFMFVVIPKKEKWDYWGHI